MTHKSLINTVDEIVNTVIAKRGLNPATGVKGGQREIAHSLVGMAIVSFRDQLLAACGVGPDAAPGTPVAPVAIAATDEVDAAAAA